MWTTGVQGFDTLPYVFICFPYQKKTSVDWTPHHLRSSGSRSASVPTCWLLSWLRWSSKSLWWFIKLCLWSSKSSHRVQLIDSYPHGRLQELIVATWKTPRISKNNIIYLIYIYEYINIHIYIYISTKEKQKNKQVYVGHSKPVQLL